MSYTQEEILKLIKTYNNTDRKTITLNLIMLYKKRGIKNKVVIEETGYSHYKVNSWTALSSPNIPTFEDALLLAIKYDFNVEELIKPI